MKTANGVEVTEGLRVINTDMRTGTVVLTNPRYKPWLENGEWWFYMAIDGRDADDRLAPVSESRVATRHPFTGKAVPK